MSPRVVCVCNSYFAAEQPHNSIAFFEFRIFTFLQLATAEGQAKLFVNFPFSKLNIDSNALGKINGRFKKGFTFVGLLKLYIF